MKFLTAFALLAILTPCRAVDWKPEDIHPKVFQAVCCWISDTVEPVVTEINLDATRSNRNQFDYEAVKKESEWITFREDREMLRFRVSRSGPTEYSAIYQENGGGSLTTQRIIRFTIESRTVEVEGKKATVAVLRVHSVQTKE